ncbi:MAG TPA: DUF4835 family protein [Crocinitomicaceae bacterium]|nr:DUF4835 family protein [Crocinitomicaceae bacterium]
MKFKLLIVSLFISAGSLFAQELNCEVSVTTNAKLEVTTVDKEILDELKVVMQNFMNDTKWTDDNFKLEERLNCNIQFQVSRIPSQGVYEGTMQVQLSRPVFNSSYNTILFKHIDESANIQFQRNTIIDFAPNQFRSNLSSILAFYAYYMLGLDYDSYSPKGGTKYFEQAFNIVQLAQSTGDRGWSNNDPKKKSRYNLIDNTLSQLFEPLRDCYYDYHRKGTDMLYEKYTDGLKAIYNALDKLSPIAQSRPNSINIMVFVQGKKNELKALYSDATQEEKTAIVNLLKKLDPVNSAQYMEILN